MLDVFCNGFLEYDYFVDAHEAYFHLKREKITPNPGLNAAGESLIPTSIQLQ